MTTPFRFDVAKLVAEPGLRHDRSPCVRIKGFIGPVSGIYVEVPIKAPPAPSDATADEVDFVNKQTAMEIAADLQNAFDTMAWIATKPDEAAADGTITAEAAEQIKRISKENP